MPVQLQPLITPFLWFDGRAPEAAAFYCRVFPDSSVVEQMQAGPDGPLMSLTIELAGQRLMLFNGGPTFRFTEAVSLFVRCATQAEVDHYWHALLDGGQAQRCGWLRDRFGLSWQIVPERLGELLSHPDPARTQRVMQSLLQMVKLDIATLENAYEYA